MLKQSFSPDSFRTFGDLLKYLRRRERLTQLELSITVGYSEAQIGRLEKNQRRPDLTTLRALFIPALHIEDDPEIVTRFLELAQHARQEDAPAPGIPPYKGLLFFDESDAELFFGRETLTRYIVGRISDLVIDSSLHFLAVVGASGSGKSSLVRAGLAVALKHANWDVRIFTPGANPIKTLEMQLESNQDGTGVERLLILVDQFEETFTLCRNEFERVAFIEQLLSLAQKPSGKMAVVIAMRADFYPHCAQYPLLRRAVAAEQEYIGQMTIDELRRAIEEPAKQGGWELEPGLVEVLLQDLAEHGSHEPEPGALPLLSHALLATWERRRKRTLTLEGYHASGGVRGAIAETAESVFTDQLSQTQQEIAREVFLRLTELGEGTQDTRRRAGLNELVRQSAEAAQLRAVLNTLAEARLIILNEDSAEVAHEALIQEWQRLHEWLMQDREGLLLHRHLTESAHEWEGRGRDPAELYRGARLAQAREWAAGNEKSMNAAEQAFIAASIELEQHEALEREAQRQRELEAAQKLAETQSRSATQLRRRAVYLIGALVLAVVAALLAGMFASRNSSLAVQNASIAQTAQADYTRSEAERLAAEANSIRLTNGDPNLIALLSMRSLNMQYTLSGDAVLTSLTTLEPPPRVFSGHTDTIYDIEISLDGKYLASASVDKTVRLWDIASGQTIHVFSGHTDEVTQALFSPDGKYILTSSYDHTVRLWEVNSGKTLKTLTLPDAIEYMELSPDGHHFVTTSTQPDALIWDVETGQVVHILSGHTKSGYMRVAYSPDGKYILTGSEDKTARLWDAATGEQLQVFDHPEIVGAVAFSPDGKYIATVCDDYVIRLWDLPTGRIVREFSGHQEPINCVEFSPDGEFLLSGGMDKTARLWDVATGQTVRIFGGITSTVQDATFSPDGRLVVTAGDDRVAKVWNLQTFGEGMQFVHSEAVRKASFSPDGKWVITASNDHTARIWDTVSGQTRIILSGYSAEVTDAVFSPNGKLVLTASADRTARLWDAASGKELRRFEGHTDELTKVIFFTDGRYVITTSYDGTARVWETQTGKAVLTYTNQGPGQLIRAAASPDGKAVVTSGEDGTARIWDPFTGKDLIVFRGHTDIVTGVAFSPDGQYLLTASWDGTVRLWDTASGKEIRRFVGHTGTTYGADFSPDGNYVLTSGVDHTARIWDVKTGQELRRFSGHTDEVRYAVFSPDGKHILTASQDGTARLWLTDLHKTIVAVCNLLTRDLTPEERTQFDISDQGPTCPEQ